MIIYIVIFTTVTTNPFPIKFGMLEICSACIEASNRKALLPIAFASSHIRFVRLDFSCSVGFGTLRYNAAMKDVVIKAQVLSGGRGRGHFDNGFKSGVHMCLK